MPKRAGRILIGFLLLCWGGAACADVIELKEGASVSGKIVAEKADHIFVDIGFTVLAVPRKEVVNITRSDSTVEPTGALPAKQRVRRQASRLAQPQQSAVVQPAPVAEQARLSSNSFYRASAQRGRTERTVRELVNLLGEAVVQVRTPGGQGSGFFINEEGYLITNFHVIEGETQISVEVYHQRGGQLERKVYKQVRIVALNKFDDLALLKIEDKDAPKFVSVPLGDSDSLAVGERVFAIGSPLGLERTVTEGIISTKTRQLQGRLYLQTTAQINPGNSGGPLFNLAGEVIGVTNMKAAYGEGLGFAIPSTAVKFFLDNRDAYAYANDNPSNPYKYLEPPSKTRLGTQQD
ncbi:MAG: trypsin-like peptidase domain-containing protein [Verrucomicrobiae bacterium]|nr:trypsin-like peptidase domain-containing protein [Verrucomicrobiae bacterium]